MRARGTPPILAALACAVSCTSWSPWPAPLPAPEMDAARIARDVQWLAADEREGRGLGSAGLALAADHLAEGFARAGLEPGGADGRYLQRFEMPVAIRVTRAEITASGLALERGLDFEPLLSSADGEIEAELVFAGYGISAPELDYDDYAGVDVEGRIALVLDGRPGGGTPLAGSRGVAFLRRAYKISNARRHGAAAVLLAPAQTDAKGIAAAAGTEMATPTIRAGEIPVLGLGRAAAERLAAGLDLAARSAAIEQTGRPASAPTGTALHIAVEIERRLGEVANVVAVSPGTDPALADETVVLGAHYDHLGRGEYGSLAPDRRGEVHNGADDNASGAAGLLELARAFGGERHRRTLVIAAFTAEEAGLVGSRHYALEPARPLERTVAMLNLDMIGRLRDLTLTVFGTETADGLEAMVERATRGSELSPRIEDGAFAPSDQISFYTRDVPVLVFFTGTHREYHTPDDDFETIDAEGMAQVLRVVYRVTAQLLDADTAPTLRAATEPPEPEAGGGAGYGPYLGTVPDFGGSEERGVVLQGVRPGSPAEVAGLRAGDRIVAFDGAPVANLEEYAALLFAARAGQRVDIELVRNGETLVVEAVLGQRR